ncbi:HAD-IA family hydrolase [Novosphingobium flavum]|uniref:HAD-IA family hydrolase n=1 Tax=Novosphingobium aerophilum TaxID=2839843 RepID=A0A7X1F6Y1_9SPHN|nr:HAD-IA family hydrolase [Novosphingobium aerophilum]MBC2651503.1 HAD-IA family hydrolase [Novosphingobium aerophilum]MBC2661946.1 HAD-IA family hydrolase [Novosphingobium aerophilum]
MSASAAIEAVVFDVGRVLVHWDMRVLFRKLIADPAELEWFCSTVVTEAWHYQHDAGRPLAEMVAERKAEFPAQAALIDAYATRFNETIPGPIEGTIALVEALHARGVPLYAITNFGADLWPRFRPTLPVLERFRDIVVSGVERIAKPDPAIYALAERRFGRAGPAMLFIDDSAANIAAVRAAGWHGHLFTDPAGLERDLTERGLL